MAAKTRREEAREATYNEIKEVARQQMAETGAAALSLNAIARQMRMSTPALYRYFDNRDALVTELVVDAYRALGDALETAVQDTIHQSYDKRFQALCHAYRDWALANPQDYTLIYGTPIPNYDAPRERTLPLVWRIFIIVGRLLDEIQRAKQLTIPVAYQHISPTLQPVIDSYLVDVPIDGVTEGLFILTLFIWSRLNGAVWAELYGHFPPGVTDSGELFQLEVTAISRELSIMDNGQEAV